MVVCGGQRCEGESRLCQRGAVEHLRAVLGGQGHFLAVDSQRAVVDCHQVVAHSGGCAGRHRHIVNLRDHVLARADIRDVAGVSHHHIEHMVVRGGQRCESESRLRRSDAVVHFRAVLGSQGHRLRRNLDRLAAGHRGEVILLHLVVNRVLANIGVAWVIRAICRAVRAVRHRCAGRSRHGDAVNDTVIILVVTRCDNFHSGRCNL